MSPQVDRGGIVLLCSRCLTRLGRAWAPSEHHPQWRYRVRTDARRTALKITASPEQRVGVYCEGCQQHGEMVTVHLRKLIAEGVKSAKVRVAWSDPPPRRLDS